MALLRQIYDDQKGPGCRVVSGLKKQTTKSEASDLVVQNLN
jgi:hypothetical protein